MKKFLQVLSATCLAAVAIVAFSLGSCSDAAVEEAAPETPAGARAIGLWGPIAVVVNTSNTYTLDGSYLPSNNYTVVWTASPSSATITPLTSNNRFSANVKFNYSGTYKLTATVNNKTTGAFVASETLAVTVSAVAGPPSIEGPSTGYVGPYSPIPRPHTYTLINIPSAASNYTFQWSVLGGMYMMDDYGSYCMIEFERIGTFTVSVTATPKSGTSGLSVITKSKTVTVVETGF